MKMRIPESVISRLSNTETYFFGCLVVWIICSVFFGRTTVVDVLPISLDIYKYGRYLVYGIFLLLLSISIVRKGYQKKEFWALLIIGAITAISVINSGEVVAISMVLFCAASKTASQKKIVGCFFFTHLAVVALTVLLSFSGVIPENITYRGSIVRYTFGFSHANALGVEMLVLILGYFFLRWKRIKLWEIILWAFLSVFFFIATNCRAVGGIILLFLICVICVKYIRIARIMQVLYWIGNAMLTVVVLLSFYFTVFFKPGNPIIDKANELLSYRGSWMSEAYHKFGISLFGHDVEVGTIDNAYARLLLMNGAVFFVLFVIILFWCLSVFYKKNDMIGLLCMMEMILLGFCENALFRMEYNFPLILALNHVLHDIETRGRGKDLYVETINRATI